MGPRQQKQPLPLPAEFSNAESYVTSLLNFGTSSQLLRTLCGGVHILDFFTRAPDLYSQALPEDWRRWFKSVAIADLLDLFMREDLRKFGDLSESDNLGWRGVALPPASLIQYIKSVRRHCLNRDFRTPPDSAVKKMDRQVSIGMNVKKVHEVDNFARYVDQLTTDLAIHSSKMITHLVDFGAGQNYLGRTLASQPYNRHIIAIESRPHVVEGAKRMDVLAKLVEGPKIMRNKKEYRASVEAAKDQYASLKEEVESPNGAMMPNSIESNNLPLKVNKLETIRAKPELPKNGQGSVQYVEHRIEDGNLAAVIDQIVDQSAESLDSITPSLNAKQSKEQQRNEPEDPALMVISLHSCGNLLHHGLRTLTLNPTVKAVALIGCCYNLMTERQGSPTYKIPPLRPNHPRLEATSSTCDPHGFPMSSRFMNYRYRVPRPLEGCCAQQMSGICTDSTVAQSQCGKVKSDEAVVTASEDSTSSPQLKWKEEENEGEFEIGISLNITARMMAVQAPQNWSEKDSSSFFKRHFYRALLQRIFLDKGVVAPPSSAVEGGGRSPAAATAAGGTNSSGTAAPGDGGGTSPIVIGTMGKKCYENFVTYVRGAVAKLSANGGEVGKSVEENIGSMADEEIRGYEERYRERKKELSIVWSLMAFSAGVVEAMVVIDRWLWLKEQDCVGDAWVEPVFEYGLSPRNLVVVGVKK